MTTTTAQVPLGRREGEAIMWTIAHIGDRPDRVPEETSDPLAVLLAAGHDRSDIMTACPTVEQFAHDGYISTPLTDLQQDILRVVVENSSWLKPYAQFGGGDAQQSAEKKVLRNLAERLETLGIAVNFIPND